MTSSLAKMLEFVLTPDFFIALVGGLLAGLVGLSSYSTLIYLSFGTFALGMSLLVKVVHYLPSFLSYYYLSETI